MTTIPVSPCTLTPAFVERVRVRTIMASLAAYDAHAWYCVYMPPMACAAKLPQR